MSVNEGKSEKVLRLLRNFNAIGAIAVGGPGIAIESSFLTGWGVLNAAQAGFFEVARRVVKNRKSFRPRST